MPSIKRDHSQLNIQVVRESRGRVSHVKRQTAPNLSHVQTTKKAVKPQGESHRWAKPNLSLNCDNEHYLDSSSASSLSTKSAFARLGTQAVVTQVAKSFTRVRSGESIDRFSCHSLNNDTTRKQVIVEKHSPPKKTLSKMVSSSLPNPPDLGSLENISVLKDNFHSVDNPDIFAPSVQHSQPEIVTIVTKEPQNFGQQFQNNFEKELSPTPSEFIEQMETKSLSKTEEENIYPSNQTPPKVFTNVLDLKGSNSDLSARKTVCQSKKEEAKHIYPLKQTPPKVFTNVLDLKGSNSDLSARKTVCQSKNEEDKHIYPLKQTPPKVFTNALDLNVSNSNLLNGISSTKTESQSNKGEEKIRPPPDQVPLKVSTNLLDSKLSNSGVSKDISTSKTSPAKEKTAVKQFENELVGAVGISSGREKENTNPTRKPEQRDCCPCETTSIQKTVNTVAVATAAALSTHPLMTSHNRLETQLTSLLEKMNSLEQQICVQKHEMEKEEKLQKLENQLSQVTNDRMEYLEVLQKQMLAMQTNFLTVAKGFEKIFGHIPDNIQQKINENEENVQPSHHKRSENILHSNDVSISEEQDFLESLYPATKTNKDNTGSSSKCHYSKNFVLNEDKPVRNPRHEHHIEKSSLKTAPRPVQTDKSVYSMKLKQDLSNPINITQRASNMKTKVLNTKETKSSSKPNRTSTVNPITKSQKTNIDKRKKFQPNITKEKSVVKGNDRNMHNMHKPTTYIAEKQSINQPPLNYSYLKTFSSNPYSKEPYVVRETPRQKPVPKRQSSPPTPHPHPINTSFIISSSPDSHQERMEVNEIENQKSNSMKYFTSSQSEAPLEKYLLGSPVRTQLFTSDKIYDGLKPAALSAELIAGQEILQRTQTSRIFLEENLKNLERDYEKEAVYNIVDNIYQTSPASQAYQMKRKVDQCIAKVQLDIQKELSSDTATVNKLSLLNPATKRNRLVKNKDSEQLNGPRQKQPKVVVKKNEKFSQGSNKNMNVLYQDQEYLTQVFGKATYQNKRTTIREPYLHIRNKPQARVAQPKAMVDVKGIQKKSAKTQTVEEKGKVVEKSAGIRADDKKYFFASKPNNDSNHLQNSGLVPGHLGYMAVSLREPRMDSGLTHAVTVRPGSSIVVAPQDQPKVVSAENVVLCNIPFANEGEKPTKKPSLSKQNLPSVDIVSKLSEDKEKKTIHFNIDSQEKNLHPPSFEKSVMIVESIDNEDEIPYERSIDGSDIAEVEENAESDVVVVNSKAKETNEPLTNNNNNNQVLPQQLKCLTGLTSELMLTKNHKIAATLATIQTMPVDAESMEQEETLKEIVQLVEKELLSQITSDPQSTPNSDVDLLQENSLTANNGNNNCNETDAVMKPGAPKIKDPITEDSLILFQLIEEILSDKVSTILEKDYDVSNIPKSDKPSIQTPPNQLESGEICQTKANESSLVKLDAVCQTSVILSNDLVAEDLVLDKDRHFTDKIVSENAVASLPEEEPKEVVLVDTAIPPEFNAVINQEGGGVSINDETAINSLNLNKTSVEQEDKTKAQHTTAGDDSDDIPIQSYGRNIVHDFNRNASKDLTVDIVPTPNISSVMQYPENLVTNSNENTDATTNQNLQPPSSFTMQPSASKLQITNDTVKQGYVNVVAQDYNKDTTNIPGSNVGERSEAEYAQEIQRRKREATLAKLRIDKMQSIYIPPYTRVRSPVRHVQLVEITSKSLDETENEKNEEKDQFVMPSSLPSQPLPQRSLLSHSPPQSPALQSPLHLPRSHKTTMPSHTTTSSQFSPSHPTSPSPPSPIPHSQGPDAGKSPRSLFSPENLDSPREAIGKEVIGIEENAIIASLEELNLLPKFDDDINETNEEDIPATDVGISESSPSSDKMSSESALSGSGSSNTAGESLSDGQWLLSQSEGQAPLYMVSDGVYKRILADVSVNSTLKDSNELTRDEMAETTYSDGEFVFQHRVPPEKDPVLQLVLKMGNTGLNPPEMLPGTIDNDAEGQRSPGELAMSSSDVGQATLETSSDYVAATSSTNMKPVNVSKMVKTTDVPQQSSHPSKQPHVYSGDKGKTNARVIFVGLNKDEETSDIKPELELENPQDQPPLTLNLEQKGPLVPKAPNTTSNLMLPSLQSPVQSPVFPSSSHSSVKVLPKSVHFSQFYGLDPIVSDSASSYDGSQFGDTSTEPGIRRTLSGDIDDMKDAQSLPRPPLLPHRIPVAIPSPGEIWDDEDIEEISFQEGV